VTGDTDTERFIRMADDDVDVSVVVAVRLTEVRQ
jgi:hypothetical protein